MIYRCRFTDVKQNKKRQMRTFNTNLTNNLAVKFCDVLHEWLAEDELHQCANVDVYNVYPDDFCDANMAMWEAWNRMFQTEHDIQSDDDVDLWNAAWELAKMRNFKTSK